MIVKGKGQFHVVNGECCWKVSEASKIQSNDCVLETQTKLCCVVVVACGMVRCEVVMSLQLQRRDRLSYCSGQPIESECRVPTAAAKGGQAQLLQWSTNGVRV